MNILIDIGHPAHVHLFKHFAREMMHRGHKVLCTCRDREYVMKLLEHERLQFISLGKQFRSLSGKIIGLGRFSWKIYKICREFKADVLISHGSSYAAIASFLCRRPHVALEDTFNFEQIRIYKPFTKYILTADYEHPLKSSKVVRYAGYHELAYLHPHRFTPDPSVRNDLGLQQDEPYVIVRFVGWQASHDVGHKGISPENKIGAVKAFSEHARVFISSEVALPAELEPYRFPLPPYRMHDAIAFASLVFGESATMVAEAGVLGIPGILVNHILCYIQEMEHRYGLVFNFMLDKQSQQKAIEKGTELLTTVGIREQWQQKRERMLRDKIDVTGWLVDFVEREFANMSQGR